MSTVFSLPRAMVEGFLGDKGEWKPLPATVNLALCVWQPPPIINVWQDGRGGPVLVSSILQLPLSPRILFLCGSKAVKFLALAGSLRPAPWIWFFRDSTSAL